ncbi:MAG: LptF/LptG family permease, partial [Bacteroidaceae bacterium]|nr:LptF/LptG family permease [Bacteroidaceae bacterium]
DHSIDSLNFRADSIGRSMYKQIKVQTYKTITVSKKDSIRIASNELPSLINTDSLLATYSLAQKSEIVNNSSQTVSRLSMEWEQKGKQMKDTDKKIRSHQADWHKKFTLSISCLIFFFIGAPLGAIIRKGGLGLPVVISVIIFVLYYIIDSGSTRVAKSGEMNMILGVWMSTLVLAPIGAFFTYKSNKDSIVFNLEVYTNFFRWLFGLRASRHIYKKEVIINDPDYAKVAGNLPALTEQCQDYLNKHRLGSAPNYYRIFTNDGPDNAIAEISEQLEENIEELTNTKDRQILAFMNNYPILSTQAHKSPSDHRWLNILLGIIVPAGLFFYIRIWLFGRRLEKDLKNIIKTNNDIQEIIKNKYI